MAQGEFKEEEEMAVINIDFSYDDNVKSSIKKAKSALQTRMNDYAGIKKDLNNISSSTSNLSSANSYIQKKINSLDSKYKKLDSFQNAITRFNDNAYNADKRVANKINTDTKQFYKRENIKTGIIYTIGSVIGSGINWLKGTAENIANTIKDAVSSAWAAVKKWYEDNKYWFDILVDVVCVVAAAATILASGGVLTTVFAVWGLAKAGTDFVFDVAAYGAYKDGDMELYEELSSSGLKEVISYHLGDAGEYIYYGMEIASAIYGIYKIGKTTVKAFKDYKNYSKLFSQESFKDIKGQIIKQYIYENVVGTGTFEYDGGTGMLKKGFFFNGKFIFKIPAIGLNTAKFVLKTTQTWLGNDSIGIKTIKTFKISKLFYDINSNPLNPLNPLKVGKFVSIKSFPGVNANPVLV